VTDDLGINSDDVAYNGGLKHHPVVIVLHHLKVGVEKPDKPGVDNTGAGVKIRPNNIMDTIQGCHHNVRVDHIPLGNDCAVHDLGVKHGPIFLGPLADPALWTAGRHDFAKRNQRDFPKIFLLGHTKIWQNNGSTKDFFKNKDRNYHNLVPKNIITNNPNMTDICIS
jgi:hypothetical protein